MAAPAEGDRDAVLGHASALRILKTCLFYPPLQALAGAVGRGGRGPGGGIGIGGGVMGGGMAGGGKGVGVGGGATTNLIARVLPEMSPPCEAARAAMDVSDSDLQQLLDKLVLVRKREGWGGAGGGGVRGLLVVVIMVVMVMVMIVGGGGSGGSGSGGGECLVPRWASEAPRVSRRFAF